MYAEQELKFGEFFVSNNSSGSVTVSSNGDWSSSGNVHLLGATQQPATFIISTDNSTPVTVQVQAFALRFQNPAGEEIPFRLSTVEPSVYTVQAGSPVRVKIGGTVDISPETSSMGHFSGRISLSVNSYND